MDVGISGLLRRLGCFGFVNAVYHSILSSDIEDRFISWKFVQPITPSIGSEALALKVHHSKLSHLHPADLADILIDLGTDERIAVLNSIDNETAAQMFQELPLKIRVQLVDVLPLERAAGIVNAMAMDEAVDLLSSVGHKKLHSIKARLPKEKVEQVNTLLKISEHAAGSLMNTDFVAVPHNATAAMVLEKIKTEAKKFESIYYIYVLDDLSAVMGVVTLRQALVSPPERPVTELMRKRVVKVHMDTDVHEVAPCRWWTAATR
jgi:Mg/Co/Ni transporter MgtE